MTGIFFLERQNTCKIAVGFSGLAQWLSSTYELGVHDSNPIHAWVLGSIPCGKSGGRGVQEVANQ